MDKILFTEENLSKIHISQFEQFLDKHQDTHKLVHDRLDSCTLTIKEDYQGYKYKWIIFIRFHGNGFLYWGSGSFTPYATAIDDFTTLLAIIYPDYVQGDLTQFHVLFTQVYNEIMGYEIK